MRTIIFYLILLATFFYSIVASAQVNYVHIRTRSLTISDSVKIGGTWLTEKDVKLLKPEGRGIKYPPMPKDEFYKQLNLLREQYGYPPLRRSSVLEMKAERWLLFLKRHDLGMIRDENTEDGEVITNAYQYLAWWMGSPQHAAVLLNTRWKRIGLAEKDGVWCARLD